MKTSKLIAALAMCATSLSPVISTAAYADDDGFITSVNDTTGATPQEICDDLLRPNNPNSDFQTEPVSISYGSWVDDGPAAPDLDNPLNAASGYGTPTYSSVISSQGGFFRNGGSPNVWGAATATTTYPQTQQMFSFYVDQTRTVTFGCRVWKYTGPDGDHLVQPPGLQTTNNTGVEHQEDVYVGDQNVITDDDFVITGATVNTLICISPNNATKSKPGTWTQKHGFKGSCTAASTAAGTTFIPSNNAPIVD
ncbi:MAG: hypothetical protein ACREBO_08515 [Novosphingobium sp.]